MKRERFIPRKYGLTRLARERPWTGNVDGFKRILSELIATKKTDYPERRGLFFQLEPGDAGLADCLEIAETLKGGGFVDMENWWMFNHKSTITHWQYRCKMDVVAIPAFEEEGDSLSFEEDIVRCYVRNTYKEEGGK